MKRFATAHRPPPIASEAVGELSSGAMLVGDLPAVFGLAGRVPIAGPVAALGAVAHGCHAVKKFSKAKDNETRVEAVHAGAWALQTASAVALFTTAKESLIHKAGSVLGVTGGLMQVAVGGYRIRTGWRRDEHGKRDWRRITLGAFDVGAGSSWAASAAAIGYPYTLGAFMTLTLGKIGYSHKEWLATQTKTQFQRAKGGLRKLGDRLLGRSHAPAAADEPGAQAETAKARNAPQPAHGTRDLLPAKI
jgi:hypothetical protein